MIRTTLAVAGALLAASLVQAQDAPVDSTTRVLITDLTFHSNSYEPIRLFLAGGRIYRAQFTQPEIVLQMRSYEGKQLPMVVTVNLGPDASGRTDFEVRPRMDGVYEFRPVYVYDGNPIRFQLWLEPKERDPAGPSVATASQGIEFGFELSAGVHGGYENGAYHYGAAGGSLSVCASVRNIGGGEGRLWGCFAGVEQETGGGDSTWTYLYLQPRLRLFGGRSSFDAGALLHVATGTVGHGRASGKYGVGIYAAHRPRRPEGGGWSALGSLTLLRVNPSDAGATGAGSWGANFGVGRYF